MGSEQGYGSAGVNFIIRGVSKVWGGGGSRLCEGKGFYSFISQRLTSYDSHIETVCLGETRFKDTIKQKSHFRGVYIDICLNSKLNLTLEFIIAVVF